MSTVALTAGTFEDTATKQGIALVDWWASWCGPCRMFAPVFTLHEPFAEAVARARAALAGQGPGGTGGGGVTLATG